MDSGRHDQSLVLGRSRPGYEDHESGADMRRRRRPSSTSTTRMALSDAISSLASGSQASGHNNGESSIRRENAERKRSTNQSESGDIGSGISGVRDRNNAESSTASDELHTASSNNEGLPRGLGFLGTLATALTLRDGRRTPWPKQQQLARRQPWRVQGSFWNASRRAPDPDIADEQHTSLRAVDPVGTDNVTVRSEGDVSLDPSLNAGDVGDIKRSFEIAEKVLDARLNGFWSDCQTLDNRVQDVETAQFTVTDLGGGVVDTETPAAQFYAGSPTETDLGGGVVDTETTAAQFYAGSPTETDLGGGVVDTETPAAQFYAGPPTDLNGCVGTPVRAPLLFGPSLEDPPEDEPTPLQCVDPSEGDALDPPGIYDSNATSGERGLEPIASTEISSLRTTTEHSNVTARGSGGLDPPSHAFFPIQDNGVIDGEGQLNILTLSGDSQQQRQQQRSCLDPPIINNETVEDDTAKQSTRDHDLVTEPSKSMRLALWGLWSGLVRLVGSGLGLALLLASGWFIGLSLEPLHRNSIQQHFIMPSCPSSLGGNALEVQHLTLTMLFIAGGNLSGDANDLQPLQVNKPVALGANNTNGLPSETEIGPWAEDVLPTPINRSDLRTDETPANDDALYIDPSSTSLVDRVSEGDECVVEITTNANNTNELQWEAEDESVKEIEITDADEMPKEIEITDADETPTEIEIIDADESLQEIEVDDGLPSLSSPFSLRTNTKPTNDDALCDDPSSTSLVDRVSEGDERVVEQTYTTAYTADCSLLPTSTSMIAHDSDPEGDGNFFSSDSDGVYVPEGEVYYTMNGDRLADDDSQLPFGFVKTYGSLALLGFADYLTIYLKNVIVCNRNWLTFLYFWSLKG